VLDAVRAAGVNAPSSCEMGICGTCETKVLSGLVDHRDEPLTDEKAAGKHDDDLCLPRGVPPACARSVNPASTGVTPSLSGLPAPSMS